MAPCTIIEFVKNFKNFPKMNVGDETMNDKQRHLMQERLRNLRSRFNIETSQFDKMSQPSPSRSVTKLNDRPRGTKMKRKLSAEEIASDCSKTKKQIAQYPRNARKETQKSDTRTKSTQRSPTKKETTTGRTLQAPRHALHNKPKTPASNFVQSGPSPIVKNLAAERCKKVRAQVNAGIKKPIAIRENDLSVVPGTVELYKPTNRVFNLKDIKIPKRKVDVEKTSSNTFYDVIAMDIDEGSDKNAFEEMEWEINEVRRELSNAPGSTALMPRDCSLASIDCCQWFIVIDTNVFISDLAFVQALRDTDVAGLGYPVIYVPHRVLCELDALKDRPSLKSESVAKNARLANTYINFCLVQKHPRLKGQSITSYMQMNTSATEVSDDKILLSCSELKKAHPNKLIVFLSNDTNLRNKAIIEDIDTFNVKQFEQNYLAYQNDDPSKISKLQIESKLKSTFKSVLEEVFQTELKRRIPHANVLEDVVDAFIQNWKSLSHSLPIPAEEQLRKIKKWLESAQTESPMSLETLLDVSKAFLTHFYVKGKRYYNSVEKAFSLFTKYTPRVKDLGALVGEEQLNSSLENIFRTIWETIYSESASLGTAREARDPSIDLKERQFVESLQRLVVSLGKVNATPLLEISSAASVHDLAVILASFTNDNPSVMRDLLVNVCATNDGRGMITNAFGIFQEALSSCTLDSR